MEIFLGSVSVVLSRGRSSRLSRFSVLVSSVLTSSVLSPVSVQPQAGFRFASVNRRGTEPGLGT